MYVHTLHAQTLCCSSVLQHAMTGIHMLQESPCPRVTQQAANLLKAESEVRKLP